MVEKDWRVYPPSLTVTIAYWVAAIVIWRLLKTGKLVKRAGWMLPIIDMPLVAVAQILQTSSLPVPMIGMVNTPAMMIGLVVFSVLSLSGRVILITAVMGRREQLSAAVLKAQSQAQGPRAPTEFPDTTAPRSGTETRRVAPDTGMSS